MFIALQEGEDVGVGIGDEGLQGLNHSFLDQLEKDGSEARHLQAGSGGDIARAVRPGAKLGHGSREILFSGREAVETDTEKVFGVAPASKFYSERVRGEV